MPRFWGLGTKEETFVTVPRGAHSKRMSIPLIVVLRDVLGYASTKKEAVKILHEEKVMINKKITKNGSLGVGLMDVIEIPDISKTYRVEFVKKGLVLRETETKDKKLGRITRKTVVKGGKTQLNLHDGTNIISEGKFKTGDSMLISLPDKKVVAHYPLTKGAMTIITGGSRRGLKGKVTSVSDRKSMLETSTVVLDVDGKKIETLRKYVFVIGDVGKPVKGGT